MQKIYKIIYFMAVILVTACAGSPSFAADDVSTVSAQGVAVKQVAPTHVRVRFRVVATGKTVQSALAKLDADRKAIEARVNSLKEHKPEFRMGDVVQQSESGQSFQQRMMAVAMAGGQKKDDSEEKRTQRLAFEASLVWPMNAAPLDRLRQLDTIEEQLRQLELIDRGKAKSDEEDEEESDEEDKSSADEGRNTAGEVKSQMQLDAGPAYDFIYQAGDAEWADLRKAAFADARKLAEEMANAAGRKLGPLRTLSNYGGAPESMFSQMEKYQSSMENMFGEGKAKFADDFPPDPRRTSIDQLRPIQIRSEINAVFVLE